MAKGKGSAKRRVCVVTGSRAEYGLLYWTMRAVMGDPSLELQVIATGMHLANEFGLTYQLIERDGFRIDAKVDMLLSGDTPSAITKSTGLGVIGFADAFATLRPDVIVVLGDRFEILAAAQAAMFARIPIAHISGGEVTEGGVDDAIRHSLTKMSYFHFVSAERYRERVIQMGEDPERVINCGDPGVENLKRTKLLDRKALGRAIGADLARPFLLVTYHPETLAEPAVNVDAMRSLLASFDRFPDHTVLITKANADEGGRTFNRMIDDYQAAHPERVFVSTSLGQVNYSSAMSHCAAVVGNSSSGIVEAPALAKPTVNIGDRQKGRLMADSIISCGRSTEEIVAAIGRALSDEFRRRLTCVVPKYGSGRTSEVIRDTLKAATLDDVRKSFRDIECRGANLLSCYLCGANDAREILRLSDVRIWNDGSDEESVDAYHEGVLLQCERCGHVFEPVDEKLTAIFNRIYSAENAQGPSPMGAGSWGTDRADRLFFKHADLDGRRSALEIGCGNGYLLSQLHQRGFNRLVGIEPSSSVREQDDPGVEILNQFADASLDLGERFDLVFSVAVFEHIEALNEVLGFCRRHLSDTGELFFTVPNAEAQLTSGDPGLFVHQHVHYFTRWSLRSLLTRNGFSVRSLVETREAFFVSAAPGDRALPGAGGFPFFGDYQRKLDEVTASINAALAGGGGIIHGACNGLNNIQGRLRGDYTLADNDENKHGKRYFGKIVQSPRALALDDYRSVIVMSPPNYDPIAAGYRQRGFTGRIINAVAE